jgi:surface polysaccharide O-acyltransferase-like enzyme
MNLDAESSLRIILIRFPLIVGVVFIHMSGPTVIIGGEQIGVHNVYPITEFIRNLISNGISRVSVPLFYFLSGFLFFYQLSFSAQSYFNKLKSRFKTLLIPFLIWNLIVLIFYAVAQTFPLTNNYFSGLRKPITSFGWFDYINAILGLTREPIAFQFWFIRDLIVLVILTPIISLMLTYIPFLSLAVLAVFWFADYWPIYIPDIHAVFFFYAGALLAFKGKPLFYLDNYGKEFILSYLLILVLDASTKNYLFNIHLHRIGIVVGVISALYLTSIIVKNDKMRNLLLFLSSSSFFIFAFHEPFLHVLTRITFKFLQPNSNILLLTIYFMLPAFVITLSVKIYFLLRKFAPTLTKVLTGGR